MDARDAYDSMLRGHIDPLLRVQGFKRRRNRFVRLELGAWQLIDFQASQFGTRAVVRFTVNLALAYLAARDNQAAWDEDRAPTEADAHVRLRLGELTASREDRWWDVEDSTDLHALGTELAGLLESVAIPWLESRATIDALVGSIRADPGALKSYELAHMEKTLLNAGEFAAAELVRAEQNRRQPGRGQ